MGLLDDALTEEQSNENEPIKMGGGASNFKPWLFKKGQSGNPGGRPKGQSMKVWVRNYLASLTDEERLEFLDGVPKDILWRMGEGQPHQTQETDVKGELKVEFHESFKKDADTPPEAKGDNTVDGEVQGN